MAENRSWSLYVQTPEELYRSRALRFTPENGALWLSALGAADGMDILEVGCGGGLFCHRLKALLPHAAITGLDRDAGCAAYAREMAAALGLDCRVEEGDATALPFPEGVFDLCFSHTVMEHVEPRAFLAEQRRVLHRPFGPGRQPQRRFHRYAGGEKRRKAAAGQGLGGLRGV